MRIRPGNCLIEMGACYTPQTQMQHSIAYSLLRACKCVHAAGCTTIPYYCIFHFSPTFPRSCLLRLWPCIWMLLISDCKNRAVPPALKLYCSKILVCLLLSILWAKGELTRASLHNLCSMTIPGPSKEPKPLLEEDALAIRPHQ